jgi:hypothetical protein
MLLASQIRVQVIHHNLKAQGKYFDDFDPYGVVANWIDKPGRFGDSSD